MVAEFDQMIDYFRKVGANDIEHTDKGYLAHAASVYRDLKSWGADEELCGAALFHSIYGTEIFQNFVLPLDRRHEITEMIGERGERIAYWNCMMDRSAFDQAVTDDQPPYIMRNRLNGEEEEFSKSDFDELCRLHLCDWLEQVPRSQQWDYRRAAYRNMAERLGGIALESYDRVFEGK